MVVLVDFNAPNGKAITGFNHEYKRHGTTTLFAALTSPMHDVGVWVVTAAISRSTPDPGGSRPGLRQEPGCTLELHSQPHRAPIQREQCHSRGPADVELWTLNIDSHSQNGLEWRISR